ncbi:MAG: hypothetical protein V4451_05855 [Pseudomonadota bacterium]
MARYQPKHEHIGALLAAIGAVMVKQDVCAGAAVDGNSDGELLTHMERQYGVCRAVGQKMIQFARDDLTAVINYCEVG